MYVHLYHTNMYIYCIKHAHGWNFLHLSKAKSEVFRADEESLPQ